MGLRWSKAAVCWRSWHAWGHVSEDWHHQDAWWHGATAGRWLRPTPSSELDKRPLVVEPVSFDCFGGSTTPVIMTLKLSLYLPKTPANWTSKDHFVFHVNTFTGKKIAGAVRIPKTTGGTSFWALVGELLSEFGGLGFLGSCLGSELNLINSRRRMCNKY